MRTSDILHFFRELDRRVEIPLTAIVTGGAAAILQGVRRATDDIDFELALKKPGGSARWDAVQKAIAETGRATGITPQFAEDIDRWSSIALPARKSKPYLRIGKVEVRILAPGLWAIGKLTRYLGSDLADMRTVLKEAGTKAPAMARLWGRALGKSPASNALGTFRRQVEQFFDAYAREIWGSKTSPDELKKLFNRSARSARRNQ